LKNLNLRILIIGNKSASNAIMQVMDLFAFYDYDHVDTAVFPNAAQLLESLNHYNDRNDHGWLLLTDYDGIELAKHIRLTDDLGKLRLLPIIVLNPHFLEYHLREKRDNIFLLSPQIYFMSVCQCVVELPGTLEKAKPCESQEKMLTELRPFITWSDDDDIISSHDNLNRFGPLQLLHEQFSTLPDYLSREYGNMSSRLWFKKYRFLELHDTRAETLFVDENHFRKMVGGKNVLYIDDEHRLGWSFALYALFTGNSDQSHYKLFQGEASVISTPDNRFTCIDNVLEALNLFESYSSSFNNALTEYSNAEFKKNQLTEKFEALKKSAKESEGRLRNAEANCLRIKSSLMEAEERLKEINARFKSALDNFLDASTAGTGIIEVPDVLPQLQGVSEIYELYTRVAESIRKYRDEQRTSGENHEKLKAEYEKHKFPLEKNKTESESASNRYKESVKTLDVGFLFPYNLVILDLRLERLKDRDRLPREISGVQLLRKIKEINPSIPVLMFTASEKAMNHQQAVDLGASGYWIKGVNTLTGIKSEIIKSLEKAEEARNLWIGIRKIEVKQQLIQTNANDSTNKLESGIIDASKKADIVMLLKESYLLFTLDPTPFELSVCNYTNYRKIAINMGMISEIRFPGIKEQKWDNYSRLFPQKIDGGDKNIRSMRNKAAHEANYNITYDIALQVFKDTLERCLRNK